MKALVGGLALLAAAAAGHAAFTVPTRMEAARLQAEDLRARRDIERNAAESRARAARDALWAQAVRAAREGPAANPMLSLRGRVLEAVERAGLADVDLEVDPGREPYAATARLAGEGDYRSVGRLLEEIDPATRGFIPESLRLSRADSADRMAFALEVQTPLATSGAGRPAASPRPAAVNARLAWERDPFRFRVVPPPPAPSAKPPGISASAATDPAPAPSAVPSRPAIRLVGLLRRGDTLLAVVSTGAELHVLAAGGQAQGFRILAVDEDAVTIQEPEGHELTLIPGS